MKKDTYCYTSADGTRSYLHEGEDGVTAEWLAVLREEDRILDANRKRYRRHNASLEAVEPIGPRFGSEDTYDTGEPAPEERLARALMELPPAQRELVRQVYYRGTQQKELAAAEGISPSAVCQRLGRVLAGLRGQLEGAAS